MPKFIKRNFSTPTVTVPALSTVTLFSIDTSTDFLGHGILDDCLISVECRFMGKGTGNQANLYRADAFFKKVAGVITKIGQGIQYSREQVVGAVLFNGVVAGAVISATVQNTTAVVLTVDSFVDLAIGAFTAAYFNKVESFP
jgi:hypothetical protein